MTIKEVRDEDVALLASISASLKDDYVGGEEIWEGSPFAWIRTRPSRQIGAVGERLVAGFLAARDFDVTKSPDSDADRIVEGRRVEIKFSTLWHSGMYKFQQLRDQNYDYAICLGVSPFDAHCWVLSKNMIMSNIGDVPGLSYQHGGQSGRDTAWLSVYAETPPGWLVPHGGRLRDGIRLLSEALSQPPR